MSEIKDYGEPWQTSVNKFTDFTLIRKEPQDATDDRREYMPVVDFDEAYFDSPEEMRAFANRIRKCINALAGRDPAKLEGLLEAVRRVSANATDMGDMCAVPSETIDGLDAALAAFEGRAES